MGSIVIRAAVTADAAALSPLLSALGYPADERVIVDRLRQLQASESVSESTSGSSESGLPGAVFVADRDGELLGFITLHRTPVLHRPTAVGRITGLAVIAKARGLGVGRLLVEAAERRFVEEGLARLEVTSSALHGPAHAFYRHLGYEDQGVRFAKVLGLRP